MVGMQKYKTPENPVGWTQNLFGLVGVGWT